MTDGLRVAPGVVIPEHELVVRASRSSGPGGQGVNTTSSKVELRWDVATSGALTEHQRQRLLDRLAPRLTNDGVLVLQGSEQRSQHQNRTAVLARLVAIVGEALEPERPRHATRPSRGSILRRLDAKRARGDVKRLRRPPED